MLHCKSTENDWDDIMLVPKDNRTESREVLKDPKSHKICRVAITMLVRVKITQM
jgi:hypothetical protein